MKSTVIYGPPGTGKTTELMDRVRGAHALCLSYTKAAAQEIAFRSNQADASTLHSLAFKALNLSRASVAADPIKMQVLSATTGVPIRTKTDDEQQEGDEYLACFSFARNKIISINQAYDEIGAPGTRPRYEYFIEAYCRWKKAYGYVDFDDMLERATKIMGAGHPYTTVCLDEAQDCTPLQWKFFHKLLHSGVEEVFVAGDDDQAIYEWSGADPHGMHKFHDGGVKYIKLEQSYRVPRTIATLASDTMTGVKLRILKPWLPRPEDGEVVRWGEFDALDILAEAPEGALILARDRFRVAEIKRMLNQDMTPYEVWGGPSPWTSHIARDLKAGRIIINEVPPAWRDFYEQADLSLPIKHIVSTIHQAKGREHDTVILDLNLPARVLEQLTLNPDAERRVQYVGLTRAKQRLILSGDNPIVK